MAKCICIVGQDARQCAAGQVLRRAGFEMDREELPDPKAVSVTNWPAACRLHGRAPSCWQGVRVRLCGLPCGRRICR